MTVGTTATMEANFFIVPINPRFFRRWNWMDACVSINV